MQVLKEIILLLQQHNVHPLKHLGGSADNKSKLLALYDGIARNRFGSDADAASILYDGNESGSSYRKLKSDLRERLLDSVFHLNMDQEQYSDYQKAYYDCHKQWVRVRFLTGQNANITALSLANRLLRQAERFDFTLLCMDVASYLRIQYGLRESNDKRFREANQQFEYYRQVYRAECLAEERYTNLVVLMVNNRSSHGEVAEQANAYFEQIGPLMDQYQTYRLHLYGYMIGLLRFTSINDHEQALQFCERAIAFFETRSYEARVPLQIFYYQHLICNIHLRQFEAGKESARHCIRLMQDGTFNWFKYKELYLHLLLHTHQYDQAATELTSALQHPRFEFLPENAKELWRINESYVYYLTVLGKINVQAAHPFKLGKFINETPIFSRDKSGMNIAILVIKLLLLLRERKFHRLLDEVEATEQYCYRHLRGDNTKRSYYFLKMLLQIPLGQFDAEVIRAKAERFLEKLKSYPLQVANQTYEIEIIPYEDLWEFALETLSADPEAGSRQKKIR